MDAPPAPVTVRASSAINSSAAGHPPATPINSCAALAIWFSLHHSRSRRAWDWDSFTNSMPASARSFTHATTPAARMLSVPGA